MRRGKRIFVPVCGSASFMVCAPCASATDSLFSPKGRSSSHIWHILRIFGFFVLCIFAHVFAHIFIFPPSGRIFWRLFSPRVFLIGSFPPLHQFSTGPPFCFFFFLNFYLRSIWSTIFSAFLKHFHFGLSQSIPLMMVWMCYAKKGNGTLQDCLMIFAT